MNPRRSHSLPSLIGSTGRARCGRSVRSTVIALIDPAQVVGVERVETI